MHAHIEGLVTLEAIRKQTEAWAADAQYLKERAIA
jgi:hypothetical protein